MKIKTLLRLIRESKGLTQLEIAKAVNISTMSYIRYETGERIPNVNIARLIAQTLEIKNLEEIFPLPQRQLREIEQQPDGNPGKKNKT